MTWPSVGSLEGRAGEREQTGDRKEGAEGRAEPHCGLRIGTQLKGPKQSGAEEESLWKAGGELGIADWERRFRRKAPYLEGATESASKAMTGKLGELGRDAVGAFQSAGHALQPLPPHQQSEARAGKFLRLGKMHVWHAWLRFPSKGAPF